MLIKFLRHKTTSFTKENKRNRQCKRAFYLTFIVMKVDHVCTNGNSIGFIRFIQLGKKTIPGDTNNGVFFNSSTFLSCHFFNPYLP